MATLAVDIGGTSLKAGIFENGELIDQKEFDHAGKDGAEFLLSALFTAIEELSAGREIRSIGLSVSGQIDPKNGIVLFATNAIPGFTGTPIRQIVEDATHLPVYVDNDVNCAALGEAMYGAGRDCSDFLCVTYGTGVGGAIIIDRKIWSGLSGVAGELGHMVLFAGGEPCVCGRRGCYERYAATTALIRQVKARTGLSLNGRQIFERFDQPEIREEIDLWIDRIAEGLISLLHIFNPTALILGGGVLKQDYVFKEIQGRVKERALPQFRKTDIRRASLGNSAGMYGAYSLTCQDKGA